MPDSRMNLDQSDGAVIDQAEMRRVCGNFLTGVTVVTSAIGTEVAGVTINSFTSVSLSPPIVLFCIHQDSSAWKVIRRASVFAVNILAEDQAEICRNFSSRSTALYMGDEVRTAKTGAPILDGALAYLDCKIVTWHPGGDHIIVMGRVIDIGVMRDHSPLIFFRNSHPRLRSIS
jgi:3-hydroxy-9,10-secoandrosta-1,3,5(10)-triene-9,17-dione monooxygenase reductase component